jgi:hypothetical protein
MVAEGRAKKKDALIHSYRLDRTALENVDEVRVVDRENAHEADACDMCKHLSHRTLHPNGNTPDMTRNNKLTASPPLVVQNCIVRPAHH